MTGGMGPGTPELPSGTQQTGGVREKQRERERERERERDRERERQ